MRMLAQRRPASQPPLEDLEDRIERAHRALLAARDWAARIRRWREMLTLLRQRPREVVARLERERMQRVLGRVP
jgi:FixJ family two-component response regulator